MPGQGNFSWRNQVSLLRNPSRYRCRVPNEYDVFNSGDQEPIFVAIGPLRRRGPMSPPRAAFAISHGQRLQASGGGVVVLRDMTLRHVPADPRPL